MTAANDRHVDRDGVLDTVDNPGVRTIGFRILDVTGGTQSTSTRVVVYDPEQSRSWQVVARHSIGVTAVHCGRPTSSTAAWDALAIMPASSRPQLPPSPTRPGAACRAEHELALAREAASGVNRTGTLPRRGLADGWS